MKDDCIDCNIELTGSNDPDETGICDNCFYVWMKSFFKK